MKSGNLMYVPDWVKDAVFYQIFPDRFANGDSSNDPPGVEQWGKRPKSGNFFGGDIQGILDRLQYIRDLGANAISLNPLFASSSNHKYNTSDYMRIDPAFGTNELFQKFIAVCHANDFHVIIDGAFNHTGTDFWAFDDIRKNGATSQYLGWYNIYSLPVASPRTPNYECWSGHGMLPKLMVRNPDVKKYLFEVTEYWTKMRIDGWRLDAPAEIPHDFWKEWHDLVKRINPQCYVVGEIWGKAPRWLQGDEFDAAMNYEFRSACLDYFCKETITTSQFDRRLGEIRSQYRKEVNLVMQNLLGSHDTERYMTACDGVFWKVKLSVLFQMMYMGTPVIYYGDEIGMEGEKDPDCRRTMIWEERKWDGELRDLYKRLIKIRASSPALRRGTYRSLVADDAQRVLAFERRLNEHFAYIVFNKREKRMLVEIPVESVFSTLHDELSDEKFPVADGVLRIPVEGHSGRIFIRSMN